MEPEKKFIVTTLKPVTFMFKPKIDASHGFLFVPDILYTLRNWQRTDLEKAFVKGHASFPHT